MSITKNSVVTFHYTLSDNEGNVLDTSDGQEAFAYLHGASMIVPGLEEQLEGKKTGDKVKAVVVPEKGYGTFNMELLQRVPLEKFGGQKVEEGMQFQAGGHGVYTVKEVKDGQVLIDGNHPLAGVTLNFDVEITGVRPATEEELAHGHVHGEGGHHH
ncbi:MAG: peptidylprolyl isomerase [Flavobacteriales bacterium]